MRKLAESSVFAGHTKAVYYEDPGLIAAIQCSKIPSTLASAYIFQELLFGVRLLPERMNGLFVLLAQQQRNGDSDVSMF